MTARPAVDASAVHPETEPTRPISPLRSGAHLDRLAELEEERRFLLRSLGDLEQERAAGDVDEADYVTLKDGYIVRAATVLRQIESGQARLAVKPPRRWGRTFVITAALVAGAIGIGFVLASAFGERGAGDELSGENPADDPRAVLVAARAALDGRDDPTGAPDFSAANALYARALDLERERGIDNVEAITYFGWTLALMARNDPDPDSSSRRLDAARIALEQAISFDPDYADPNCFLAIVEFNFLGDADAALPLIDACEANDPPTGMTDFIGAFADEIRSAAAG